MTFTARRRPRALLAIIAALLATSCGGSSTTTPSTVSSFTSGNWSVSGQIVSAVESAPVPFARLTFNQQALTTSETGAFLFNGNGAFPAQPLRIESDTTLTRETFVSAAGAHNIDVISTAPPFSETLYRELAFNGLENPSMRPLFHWTTQPRFFVRTVYNDTGEPVPSAYIDITVAEIERVTPQWTGGMFTAAVTTGPDVPGDTTNRITVQFVHPAEAQTRCGSTTVSCAVVGNPSTIWFNVIPSATPTCWASSAHVAHEVGHSLGYWHISGVGVMRSGGGAAEKGVPSTCTRTVDITASEQYHARVLYSRPSGSAYPDRSPLGYSIRSLDRGPGILVVD